MGLTLSQTRTLAPAATGSDMRSTYNGMLLGHETAAPKATTSTERPQECKQLEQKIHKSTLSLSLADSEVCQPQIDIHKSTREHTMGFGPLQQQDYSLLLQKPSETPTKSEAMAATRILWAFSLGSGGK